MKINYMLIDDREIDLFINQKIIEKFSTESNFKTFTKAKLALEYLDSLYNQASLESMFFPDIILLDINMPEMNGFQFLNKFSELNSEKLNTIKIYMLSSTTNLKEIIDAEQHSACSGFIDKPLSVRRIQQITQEFVLD